MRVAHRGARHLRCDPLWGRGLRHHFFLRHLGATAGRLCLLSPSRARPTAGPARSTSYFPASFKPHPQSFTSPTHFNNDGPSTVTTDEAVAYLTALRSPPGTKPHARTSAGGRQSQHTSLLSLSVPEVIKRTAVQGRSDAERLLYALSRLSDGMDSVYNLSHEDHVMNWPVLEAAHSAAVDKIRMAGVDMDAGLLHHCLRFFRHRPEKAYRTLIEALESATFTPTAATFDVCEKSLCLYICCVLALFILSRWI